MEILEILSNDPLDINNAKFTVDNTQTIVPITNANLIMFKNSAGLSIFTRGDNLVMLSCGVIMPQGFTLTTSDRSTLPNNYNKPLGVEFYLGSVTNTFNIPLYSQGQGGIIIPFNDYEMSLGNFCDSIRTEQFVIRCSSFNGGVSMLNVPNSLNGKTFNISMFVKVIHNYHLG